MLTVVQHKTIFENFQDAQQQLHSFGFGDPAEWYEKLKQNAEDLVYPAMFVVLLGTAQEGERISRNYKAFFCDRQRHAEENEDDGLSDMERAALSFIPYVNKVLIDDYVVVRSGPLTALTESSIDYLVGYEMDFSLIETYDNDKCIIPLDDTSFPSTNPCPSTTINLYLDGVLMDTVTVASGASETINVTW